MPKQPSHRRMADASSLSGPEPPGDGITSDAIIQVAPTLEGVRLLGAALRGVCLQVLTDDEASEMELALVEAATNIVKHAFSGMTGGQLSAELKIGETFVEVVLCDNGAAFNPLLTHTSAPWAEDDYKDFDDLPENGLGLGLIVALTDGQSYHRENGKNALRLQKTRKVDSN